METWPPCCFMGVFVSQGSMIDIGSENLIYYLSFPLHFPYIYLTQTLLFSSVLLFSDDLKVIFLNLTTNHNLNQYVVVFIRTTTVFHSRYLKKYILFPKNKEVSTSHVVLTSSIWPHLNSNTSFSVLTSIEVFLKHTHTHSPSLSYFISLSHTHTLTHIFSHLNTQAYTC